MTNKLTCFIKKALPAGRQGFTLMETLVAVLVLSLAITGPLVIAQKGLQTALISKDQVAAFELAQDAIEYVRYARDTNRLSGNNWLAGAGSGATYLLPCISSTGATACTVDAIALSQPTTCVGGLCAPIKYDAANNYFTYSSGSASIFTRTIEIVSPVCNVANTVCNTSEASVSVAVQWNDPISHTITVRENLFDWQ